MISVMFKFAGEYVLITILGSKVYFSNSKYGSKQTTIEYLQLDKKGVIKEFPDLAKNSNWRDEAIKRFKDKISSMKTEEERVEYIINDLTKYGYVPMYKQKNGFRVEAIKNDKLDR